MLIIAMLAYGVIVACICVFSPFIGTALVFLTSCLILFNWSTVERVVAQRKLRQLGAHYTVFQQTKWKDHLFHNIILSPFGIFFIQYVPYKGKIYGDLQQEQWAAKSLNDYTTFDNPYMEMRQQIEALQRLCGCRIDATVMLVFPNKVKFMKPEEVKGVCVKQKQLVDAIELQSTQQISYVMLQQVEQTLRSLQEKRSWKTKWQQMKESGQTVKATKLTTQSVQGISVEIEVEESLPHSEEFMPPPKPIIKRIMPKQPSSDDWS